MAAWKPVLGSKIPVHRELIDISKAGLIFEENIDEIAEKVKIVYENRIELGRLAKKFAEMHDWQHVCRQIAQVYRELV